ncbi:hypothetical protein, partial [Pseudomonas aeruginosa]|uniref:hypothetical protein n=1 Tax=Pseudomonas aeruginosa TaxID=287 RepID=UPI0035A1927E
MAVPARRRVDQRHRAQRRFERLEDAYQSTPADRFLGHEAHHLDDALADQRRVDQRVGHVQHQVAAHR